MTSSERSHDAAANQPHDTPEIREKVQALFDRATKPIVYAPEVEDVRQLDRPTSRVFRVALRHATRGNGNGAVTFNPGELAGSQRSVKEGYLEQGPHVAISKNELTPIDDARQQFSAVVAGMCSENDTTGKIETTAQRVIEVAGQPAVATVKVIQGVKDGELYTRGVDFLLQRPMPDGTHAMLQNSVVRMPGPLNEAVFDRDGIVDDRGLYSAHDDAARAEAAAVLPEDPRFPLNARMGFDQCANLLIQ